MNRFDIQKFVSKDIKDLNDKLSMKSTGFFERKIIERIIRNYKLALEMLDREIDSGHITSTRKILGLINFPIYKEYTRQVINNFNNGNPDNLDVILCKRLREDFDDYYKVLDNHKLSVCFDMDVVRKYSVGELDGLLKLLTTKYDIEPRHAYRIIFHSNSDRISKVLDLIDLCKFGNVYYDSYYDLFFKLCDLDDKAYDNFRKNMILLCNNGIMPQICYYTATMLIKDNGLYEKNVEILKSYGLLPVLDHNMCEYLLEIMKLNNGSLDNLHDNKYSHFLFSIITCPNLAEKIDIILEMGCFDFLKNNLSSLENDYAKRLQALKCIGTPVFDQETYNITMSSSRFVLGDKEIDEEIYSAVENEFNHKLNIKLSDLDQFKMEDNDNLYSIGGVLVSVNKVKRLFDEGKDIYISITSGLILSDDEYNSMMDVLQPLQYKKNN